jgi:protein SCO1/2
MIGLRLVSTIGLRLAFVVGLLVAADGSALASRTVRDQDGRPFAFGSLRGREVAAFFGYTHCPDVCPTVLATLALVQRRLPPGARFQVVFVTVDPARDSPARVKRFVEAFDPRFIGVTGDPAALAPLYRSFKIWSAKVPNPDGAGYLLAHESGIALLDARGAVRTTLPWNASTDTIAAAVKALLP